MISAASNSRQLPVKNEWYAVSPWTGKDEVMTGKTLHTTKKNEWEKKHSRRGWKTYRRLERYSGARFFFNKERQGSKQQSDVTLRSCASIMKQNCQVERYGAVPAKWVCQEKRHKVRSVRGKKLWKKQRDRSHHSPTTWEWCQVWKGEKYIARLTRKPNCGWMERHQSCPEGNRRSRETAGVTARAKAHVTAESRKLLKDQIKFNIESNRKSRWIINLGADRDTATSTERPAREAHKEREKFKKRANNIKQYGMRFHVESRVLTDVRLPEDNTQVRSSFFVFRKAVRQKHPPTTTHMCAEKWKTHVITNTWIVGLLC